MKKSQNIILSAILLTAIASCDDNRNQWTRGTDASGHARDTAVYQNGGYHYFRYYGGGWYPLGRNNIINVGTYAPASASEISSPSFAPRAASGMVHSGGFGSSAGEGGAGE